MRSKRRNVAAVGNEDERQCAFMSNEKDCSLPIVQVCKRKDRLTTHRDINRGTVRDGQWRDVVEVINAKERLLPFMLNANPCSLTVSRA
jgi:hypothetical protein